MTKGTRNVRFAAYVILSAAVLIPSCLMFGADQKKAAAPAAAPKAAAPAAHAPSGGGAGGAHPGGAGAGAGGSHGPTTTSHGPTTSSPHATTTSPHGATTTSPHGATTTSPHGATTSTPHAATSTAGRPAGTPGKTGSAASPASRTGGTAGTAGKTGTATTAGGHGWSSGKTPNGAHVTTAKNGATVAKRADGKVATVHDTKRNMDVHHNLNGGRHIVKERADHSRVVVERGGRGYVQRTYAYGGREYVSRTYVYGGGYYNAYYANYYWHGAAFYPYYPAFYYGPAYYGWVYNPWVAPISYGWGWAGNPWYGYYGAYFTPWPTYPSAAFWLTDYLIAQSLQAAYVAQAAALSNPAPMTPDVKQLVADEVKRQIALENAEAQNANPDPASSSIQRMLTDGTQHVFIAGADLDVVDSAGSECAISEGDALQLNGQTAPDAQAANLVVLASKGGRECPKGDLVSVGFEDLQEMQNHMRQTIDSGMKDLQAKQGTGGLPAAPSSAKAAPKQSAYAQNAPPPDQNAAQEVQQENQEADQAEKEAGETPAPLAAPAAPAVEITTGMTIDQVVSAQGEPVKKAKVGTKEIYYYKDQKITFVNGKVTDIQ